LDEEGEKCEAQDLWEGHDVKFLEVLQEFVMIVAGNGLHEYADEHGHGEKGGFDHNDSRESREPVCGLAHG